MREHDGARLAGESTCPTEPAQPWPVNRVDIHMGGATAALDYDAELMVRVKEGDGASRKPNSAARSTSARTVLALVRTSQS